MTGSESTETLPASAGVISLTINRGLRVGTPKKGDSVSIRLCQGVGSADAYAKHRQWLAGGRMPLKRSDMDGRSLFSFGQPCQIITTAN
jgi:hypothetical protein